MLDTAIRHSNPNNWHAKTGWGPSSPATIPSSGKRNLAVAVLVSKTSGGASWPQQCCEYGLLSCKQQGTKVEGGVIAAMWLHKVRKCVRFTRYQNKSTRKESFFLHERSGHALNNLSERLTHSQHVRRETAISILSVDSHHNTMTQEYFQQGQSIWSCRLDPS